MGTDYTVPPGQFYDVSATDSFDTIYISAGAKVANVLGGKVNTFTFLSDSGWLNTLGPPYWTGTISGFQAGNNLGVQDIGGGTGWASYHYDDATQTLNFLDAGGNNVGYVHIAEPSPGYYTDANITAAPIPVLGAGANITTTVPCFVRGSRILTDRGEVPVEQLQVGDRVRTVAGVLKPIIWIGCGYGLLTRANRMARPIIVRRGALGDNIPHRDLHLTPGHKLYLDGFLIPVEHLVNHRSIVWDEAARLVEYYHIELESHDVLLAEGAPAETYYDDDNRAQFQNIRNGSTPGRAKPVFAPVLHDGDAVERIWTTLFARAGGPVAAETVDDPDLYLLLDETRLDPFAAEAGRYYFRLDPPAPHRLRLRSRSGVPSLLGLNCRDHRRLGVAIKRIVMAHAGNATCFDYDAPQLGEGGCHPPEAAFCWTDGELELPPVCFAAVDLPFLIRVETEPHLMRYPIAPARARAA